MSFHLQVTIAAQPAEIFTAIARHVQQWWGYTDNPVSQTGDTFTTRFDQTFWTFMIAELVTPQKIVWECVDARHVHEGYNGIETEWIGTRVEWIIEPISEGQSILKFQHDGLTPDLNCYEICTPAWERFVTQSLKAYVESGVGMPHLV